MQTSTPKPPGWNDTSFDLNEIDFWRGQYFVSNVFSRVSTTVLIKYELRLTLTTTLRAFLVQHSPVHSIQEVVKKSPELESIVFLVSKV